MDFGSEPIEIAAQLVGVSEREGSLEEATARFTNWVRERVVPRT